MTLTLSTSSVQVNTFVSATWTVRLERERLSHNAVQMDAFVRTTDRDTNEPVDIVHSNVHSCAFGSNCDPFRSGDLARDNTRNQVALFNASSEDDVVSFSSQEELLFPQTGTFSVLAHIILPGRDSTRERFDFAVYRRLEVVAEPTPAPSMLMAQRSDDRTTTTEDVSSSQSLRGPRVSCGVIAAIVLACLLLLAVFTCIAIVWGSRRRRHRLAFAVSPTALSPHARSPPFLELVAYETKKQQLQQHRLDSAAPGVVVHAAAAVAQDGRRRKMEPPTPAPYQSFASWMSPPAADDRAQTVCLPQFVTDSEVSDVTLGHSHSLQLYNRETIDATQFLDGTTSFEVPLPAQHRERPARIFGTTNSVDFVYSDTDSSMIMEIMEIDGTILMPPPEPNDSFVGSFAVVTGPPLRRDDLQDRTRLNIQDLETPQAVVTSPRAT
ncbi:hypothetical protein PINS_up009097 [Pythium insidiosum]|nr:hypothetical protein PINS_up009097 [Pythium insidiosum]